MIIFNNDHSFGLGVVFFLFNNLCRLFNAKAILLEEQ